MSTRRRGWLEPNQICLTQGNAVAMNLMFETKKDHERFITFWYKYMGKMTTLIDYQLNPTGWIVLFRTKTEDEIKLAYYERLKKSRKSKMKNLLTDSKRILSEQFRIFLSQYARRTNAFHKRKGTLVLERFRKYILNEHSEYEKLFEILSREQRIDPQHNPRYRTNKNRYDEALEMEKDSPWKKGIVNCNEVREKLAALWRGELGIEHFNPVLRKFATPSKFQNIHPPYS